MLSHLKACQFLINWVSVNAKNLTLSPPKEATVYTHLWLSGKTLIDPPKSPDKLGDFDFISPLFKGGRGDQNGTCKFKKTCVYTVA